MLIVLGLIDVVMIFNLLVMVIVGGYEIFVLCLCLEGYLDQLEWLSYVNVSVLKVKLVMVIIGIFLIYLLKIFIVSGVLGGILLCMLEQMSVVVVNIGVVCCLMLIQDGVLWQIIIYCVFILLVIGIVWIDKLMFNGYSKLYDKVYDY